MDYSEDHVEGKEVLEIQSRVKKGIKWLDKTFGRDKWKKKIDLNNLDLSSPNTCMIHVYDRRNMWRILRT